MTLLKLLAQQLTAQTHGTDTKHTSHRRVNPVGGKEEKEDTPSKSYSALRNACRQHPPTDLTRNNHPPVKFTDFGIRGRMDRLPSTHHSQSCAQSMPKDTPDGYAIRVFVRLRSQHGR